MCVACHRELLRGFRVAWQPASPHPGAEGGDEKDAEFSNNPLDDYADRAYMVNEKFCGYGVIGSRVRLRIWCRKAWGFESLYPHTKRQTEEIF